MTAPSEEKAPLHPIQLEFVLPRELTLRVKAPAHKSYSLPEGGVLISGTVSIVTADRRFQATTCATIGEPDLSGPIPLFLKVDLVGGFVINSLEVSDETARKWAVEAAQFTLMPYLREQVAGLTNRAGFNPILIPLVQLPPFTASKVKVFPADPANG